MPSTTRAPVVARGVGRLAFDAVEQLTHIVEAMHSNIAAVPLPLGRGTDGRTRGITGFVYDRIRFVNAGARSALDGGLALLAADGPAGSGALLSVLNGVLGDHLAATGNPLAIPMQLRQQGEARGKLVVFIHGLCMNDRQWTRNGHDHSAALARDLGVTPAHVLYNTGLHVSENGRELAGRLEALLARWPEPAPELAIVAHSMGGLVARSACHHAAEAGHGWLPRLRKLVFLGTPHHGAPLERGGHWLDQLLGLSPYVAPIGRLGMLRSAGITDLRHGNVRDEDWQGRDRFARHGDCRVATPLPAGVVCHALAAANDVLVPVGSALGRCKEPSRTLGFPAAHCWVGEGMNHFDLLDREEVYARLRTILT